MAVTKIKCLRSDTLYPANPPDGSSLEELTNTFISTLLDPVKDVKAVNITSIHWHGIAPEWVSAVVYTVIS